MTLATLIGMGVALWYIYRKEQAAPATPATAPTVDAGPSAADTTGTATPITEDNSSLAQYLNQVFSNPGGGGPPTKSPNGTDITPGGPSGGGTYQLGVSHSK